MMRGTLQKYRMLIHIDWVCDVQWATVWGWGQRGDPHTMWSQSSTAILQLWWSVPCIITSYVHLQQTQLFTSLELLHVTGFVESKLTSVIRAMSTSRYMVWWPLWHAALPDNNRQISQKQSTPTSEMYSTTCVQWADDHFGRGLT